MKIINKNELNKNVITLGSLAVEECFSRFDVARVWMKLDANVIKAQADECPVLEFSIYRTRPIITTLPCDTPVKIAETFDITIVYE